MASCGSRTGRTTCRRRWSSTSRRARGLLVGRPAGGQQRRPPSDALEHADRRLPRRGRTSRRAHHGLAVYAYPDGPFTYGDFRLRSIAYDVPGPRPGRRRPRDRTRPDAACASPGPGGRAGPPRAGAGRRERPSAPRRLHVVVDEERAPRAAARDERLHERALRLDGVAQVVGDPLVEHLLQGHLPRSASIGIRSRSVPTSPASRSRVVAAPARTARPSPPRPRPRRRACSPRRGRSPGSPRPRGTPGRGRGRLLLGVDQVLEAFEGRPLAGGRRPPQKFRVGSPCERAPAVGRRREEGAGLVDEVVPWVSFTSIREHLERMLERPCGGGPVALGDAGRLGPTQGGGVQHRRRQGGAAVPCGLLGPARAPRLRRLHGDVPVGLGEPDQAPRARHHAVDVVSPAARGEPAAGRVRHGRRRRAGGPPPHIRGGRDAEVRERVVEGGLSHPFWVTRTVGSRTPPPAARRRTPTTASHDASAVSGSSGMFTGRPRRGVPAAGSSTKPVPGNRVEPRLVDRDREHPAGRPRRWASTPSPWCTSRSTYRTRWPASRARAIASAVSLSMQKPLRTARASRGGGRRPDGTRGDASTGEDPSPSQSIDPPATVGRRVVHPVERGRVRPLEPAGC